METKLKVICPTCEKDKYVSRAMVFLIKKGKNTSKCRSCASTGRQSRLGQKASIETRKKMSESAKGRKKSQEHKNNISLAKKGLPVPWATGSNNWKWVEDRTRLKKYSGSEERRSPAYKRWRYEVWLRDKFTCKIANPDCSGRIEVHHILAWSTHPELRYEINNGITLCHAHHPKKRAEEKRLIPTFQELVSVSSK